MSKLGDYAIRPVIPIISVAIIALILGLDFRENSPLIQTVVESDIRDWFANDRGGFLAIVWEWQTLITGILAVNAANFTIWQMRRSDERADTRHSELVGLGLRSEALIVERVCGRKVPELTSVVSELKRRERRMADLNSSEAHDWDTAVNQLLQLAGKLSEDLEDGVIEQIKPFLSSQGTVDLEEAQASATRFVKTMQDQTSYDTREGRMTALPLFYGAQRNHPDVSRRMERIRNDANIVETAVLQFIDRLNVMNSRFSIVKLV